MGNFEVAGQGGGPESVPSDTSQPGSHQTGTGREGSPGVPGSPVASIPSDTHTVGDHSTGTGRNGTPGGDGGPANVAATPGPGGNPPDTSR